MSCPWPTADWQPVFYLWHPDGVLNAHDGLRASSSGPTCTASADTRLDVAPAVPVAACISCSALLAQQLHMTAPLFAVTARLLLFLACHATWPRWPSDAEVPVLCSPPAPVCSPDRPQRMHLPSSVYSRRARGHATRRRARETCFSAPRRFSGCTRCKRPRPAAPGPVCAGRLPGRCYPPLRDGSIGVTW